MDANDLKTELEFYEERKQELLKSSPGHFVLIKDREVLGTFHTFEDAYKASLEKLGSVPVLIKQVLEVEPVQQIPALTYGLARAAL